jgi:hypothetical protein
MRRATLSVSLVAALTGLVSAQQPPVKTVTTGVIVDVTVMDGKGNPVLDVGADEFELSEDGVRQQIVSATLVISAREHQRSRCRCRTDAARADDLLPAAYQPTNTKNDGTFRKISVKVKRSKVTVRARPGYVAVTRSPGGA